MQMSWQMRWGGGAHGIEDSIEGPGHGQAKGSHPPAGVMEKCPECGFKASLTEAEAVVGKMGGHMPGVPTRDVLLSASGCR